MSSLLPSKFFPKEWKSMQKMILISAEQESLHSFYEKEYPVSLMNDEMKGITILTAHEEFVRLYGGNEAALGDYVLDEVAASNEDGMSNTDDKATEKEATIRWMHSPDIPFGFVVIVAHDVYSPLLQWEDNDYQIIVLERFPYGKGETATLIKNMQYRFQLPSAIFTIAFINEHFRYSSTDMDNIKEAMKEGGNSFIEEGLCSRFIQCDKGLSQSFFVQCSLQNHSYFQESLFPRRTKYIEQDSESFDLLFDDDYHGFIEELDLIHSLDAIFDYQRTMKKIESENVETIWMRQMEKLVEQWREDFLQMLLSYLHHLEVNDLTESFQKEYEKEWSNLLSSIKKKCNFLSLEIDGTTDFVNYTVKLQDLKALYKEEIHDFVTTRLKDMLHKTISSYFQKWNDSVKSG